MPGTLYSITSVFIICGFVYFHRCLAKPKENLFDFPMGLGTIYYRQVLVKIGKQKWVFAHALNRLPQVNFLLGDAERLGSLPL